MVQRHGRSSDKTDCKEIGKNNNMESFVQCKLDVCMFWIKGNESEARMVVSFETRVYIAYLPPSNSLVHLLYFAIQKYRV
jgi:hypothetical protein